MEGARESKRHLDPMSMLESSEVGKHEKEEKKVFFPIPLPIMTGLGGIDDE